MMRINLRQTKPMKRYLVYTTDDLRMRPIDPTRFYTPAALQNRRFVAPVEKVGLDRLLGRDSTLRHLSPTGWLLAYPGGGRLPGAPLRRAGWRKQAYDYE